MKIIDIKPDDNKAFEEAASILKRGGLVAFPTETVFGLGCSIENEAAIKKIYEVKGRSFQKPLSIHAASMDVIRKFVKEVPKEVEALADMFIPGPLMMILDKSDLVPPIVTGGTNKIGIRIPSNSVFASLAKAFDGIIVATSANISGHYSPTTKEHVIADLDDKIDLLISSVDENVLGIESTVVDFTVNPFRVLRSGFINYREIAAVCGKNMIFSSDGDLARDVQTSSNLKIVLFEGEKSIVNARMRQFYEKMESSHPDKTGLLVLEGSVEGLSNLPNLKIMGSSTEPEILSRNFYACLRSFEKDNIEVVLVEGIQRDGVGWAIMDRLSSMASEIIK